jgi:small-conductance mechanosensitive channel/CRP-like cAMP-binding protein
MNPDYLLPLALQNLRSVAFGISAGVIVLLLAALALRKGERMTLLRLPLVLFTLHIVCMGVRLVLAPDSIVARTLELLAFALLLFALGRAVFIMLVDGILASRLDRPIPRIIRDITQGFIFIGVMIIVLREFGVDASSLLTTSALLTAIIGLSLQETLGNLFAGLAIQAQQPFEVGDWINTEADPKLLGRVIEINWRATTVITAAQVELIIPNGVLAKSTIRNYTKPNATSRRELFVQAPYDIAPSRVEKALLSAVEDVEGLIPVPPPTAQTRNFADSGIDYRLTYFVDDFLEGDRIDSEVRQRIWFVFQRAGIPIPFPTRTLQMQNATPEKETEESKLEVARRKASLLRVDFLRLLPEEALDKLAQLSRTLPFMPGEAIIRQGDPGAELYIVQRGEVAVVVGRSETHSVAELARLGPGEFFGEMSLMTGEKRAATVRAFNECEIVEVGKEAFQAVIAPDPKIVEPITRILADRQHAIEENLNARAKRSRTSAEGTNQALLEKIRAFFQL